MLICHWFNKSNHKQSERDKTRGQAGQERNKTAIKLKGILSLIKHQSQSWIFNTLHFVWSVKYNAGRMMPARQQPLYCTLSFVCWFLKESKIMRRLIGDPFLKKPASKDTWLCLSSVSSSSFPTHSHDVSSFPHILTPILTFNPTKILPFGDCFLFFTFLFAAHNLTPLTPSSLHYPTFPRPFISHSSSSFIKVWIIRGWHTALLLCRTQGQYTPMCWCRNETELDASVGVTDWGCDD